MPLVSNPSSKALPLLLIVFFYLYIVITKILIESTVSRRIAFIQCKYFFWKTNSLKSKGPYSYDFSEVLLYWFLKRILWKRYAHTHSIQYVWHNVYIYTYTHAQLWFIFDRRKIKYKCFGTHFLRTRDLSYYAVLYRYEYTRMRY